MTPEVLRKLLVAGAAVRALAVAARPGPPLSWITMAARVMVGRRAI